MAPSQHIHNTPLATVQQAHTQNNKHPLNRLRKPNILCCSELSLPAGTEISPEYTVRDTAAHTEAPTCA